MLTCDRCGQDGAIKINLSFKIPNQTARHIEDKDMCPSCLLGLTIRLLDRLPNEERVPFFQQFIKGIIL